MKVLNLYAGLGGNRKLWKDVDVTAIENNHAIAAMRHQKPVSSAEPIENWSEEDGNVLWWFFPVCEPPYCGTPLDTNWPTMSGESYHTHFTRITVPSLPKQEACDE